MDRWCCPDVGTESTPPRVVQVLQIDTELAPTDKEEPEETATVRADEVQGDAQNTDQSTSCRRKMLHHYLELFFHWLGCTAARHPRRLIAIATVSVAGIGWGMAYLQVNSDYETTWIPQRTQAWEDRTALYSFFQRPPRVEQVILMAHETAATQAAMQEALQLHSDIVSLQGYDDLCLRAQASMPCMVQSVLGVWNYSANTIASANVSADLSNVPLIDLQTGATLVPEVKAVCLCTHDHPALGTLSDIMCACRQS